MVALPSQSRTAPFQDCRGRPEGRRAPDAAPRLHADSELRYGRLTVCQPRGRPSHTVRIAMKVRSHGEPSHEPIIDPSEELRNEFLSKSENKGCDFILGTGYDAHTLQVAGIDNAVGIVSGTDNDSNNLSIIMTACELNSKLFVVARQNKKDNERLFLATKANLIMQPSDIIARKIRTLLTTPLMIDFLNKATDQDQEWSNIAISRLSGVIGDSRPNTWTVNVNENETKALHEVLKYGRTIRVGNILQNSLCRETKLNAVPLMLKRENKIILLPTDDVAIKLNDEILICGTEDSKNNMNWTLNDIHSINYIMTYEDIPDSYIMRKLHSYLKKNERRKTPRKQLLYKNRHKN